MYGVQIAGKVVGVEGTLSAEKHKGRLMVPVEMPSGKMTLLRCGPWIPNVASQQKVSDVRALIESLAG